MLLILKELTLNYVIFFNEIFRVVVPSPENSADEIL